MDVHFWKMLSTLCLSFSRAKDMGRVGGAVMHKDISIQDEKLNPFLEAFHLPGKQLFS